MTNRATTAAGLLACGLLLAACASPSSAAGTGSSGTPTSSTRAAPTTTTTTQLPVEPVDGTVTVLVVGDSLGIDLGWGLQWALSADDHVTVIGDGYGDSGLANSGFYDWPSVLESELAEDHPQVVVVFLGANDVQNFYDSAGQYESFGSASWRQAYGARVAEMMSEATTAGARVLWVGMPPMESPTFSGEIQQIDSVFESEAASHRGVTYFSSWQLFSTPSGAFNGGDTDVTGIESPLRDPDGIHLATGGEDLLGSAVARELRTLYRLP